VKERGGRIRAAELCQRAGISQSKLNQWASRQICRGVGREGADEQHAAEVVLAAALMDALHDTDCARRAIAQLRPGLQKGSFTDHLAVVWDEDLEEAVWAVGDAAIGALVKHGRRVRVIVVGPRLRSVLASIRRLLEDRPESGA